MRARRSPGLGSVGWSLGAGGGRAAGVRGVAAVGDERVAWSVIRKHVAAGSERVEDLRYWRREPLAYSSGLLTGLTSVRTPRCFEQNEDDSGVVMWLEDLPGSGARTV